MAPRLREIGLGLVAVLALSAAVYSWYRPEKVVNRTEYMKVPEIKETIKIQRVEVPGPERIVTIEKEKVVKELSMPGWIAADKLQQVIATASLPASRGGYNAVTLLNTQTGEGQIVAKERPLSLFAFENGLTAGLRFGLSSQLGQAGDVHVGWTFLRIGIAHVGAYGELNNRPEAKAMLAVDFDLSH